MIKPHLYALVHPVLLVSALAVALLIADPAAAHDFWADAADPVLGSPATIVFGYGHGFPDVEVVDAADFDARFNPPQLMGPRGNVPVSMGKDAMTYASEAPLEAGTYTVLTENRPGFGSVTPDGYRRGSKKDNPTATACTLSHRYGKKVFALGGPAKGFDEPRGQGLEIVPMKDPTSLKVRQPLPAKVYFNGKPLPGAEVRAYFAGFTPDNAASAFVAQTRGDGQVDIIPLAPGRWLATVSEDGEYPDSSVCDRESWVASLTFTVSE
ncbi:MAG: DUF4198 domain-containing protein [Deltaproteobacteria bacterium]|jgi:uncharacterized GH25 family protein|nr:DUF4198 domain-containing protein [Deltaproteobacteria bacterium]